MKNIENEFKTDFEVVKNILAIELLKTNLKVLEETDTEISWILSEKEVKEGLTTKYILKKAENGITLLNVVSTLNTLTDTFFSSSEIMIGNNKADVLLSFDIICGQHNAMLDARYVYTKTVINNNLNPIVGFHVCNEILSIDTSKLSNEKIDELFEDIKYIKNNKNSFDLNQMNFKKIEESDLN